MNIILFGFKNCGKTTIGKLLATKLNMQFVDIDDIIAKNYNDKHQVKLSVHKIYITLGEKIFRQREKEAVATLLNLDNAVIATGGGSVLSCENISMLQKIGTLIYLKTAESALKHRLMSKTLPAFIAQNNPENSFAEIYNTRIKCYENINAIMIDTKNLSHKAIIEKIINELRR